MVLAEHPRELAIERDYDASLPEFRGDREQLIQALVAFDTDAVAGREAGEGGEGVGFQLGPARHVRCAVRR